MVDKLLLPISRQAQALLAAERTRVDDDEKLKARVLAQAQATLDGERLSGVAFRASSYQPAPRTRSRVLRAALLLAAVLAVGGLAAASIQLLTTDAPNSTSAVAPHPRPRPGLAIRSQLAARATRAVASSSLSSGVSGRPNAAKKYATELELLEPARACSVRGDHQGALSAIAKHQHEFPNGQLAEEREALRIRALWGLGQKPAADAAAAVFRAQHPRSGLLSWMSAQQAE